MGTNTNGGGGNGNGDGTGSGVSGTGTGIIKNPGATSTSVATGTEVTEKDACAVQEAVASKQASDLLLVLDRSGSMTWAMDSDTQCTTFGGGGGGRRDAGTSTCQARWATMKTALAQILTISAGNVNWGLKLYSTPRQSACAVSDAVEVAIASGNAKQMNDAINSTQNAPSDGRTPTREAVNKGKEYLKGLTGPESKSILLATDGQPNCQDGNDDTAVEDVAATTSAIQAAADAGFKVYVLGIGPEASKDALNGFAAAGKTEVKDVSGPGKNYYAALSAEELSKQFESIVSNVISCTFSLSPPKNADFSNVVVEFDGNKSQRASRDTEHKNGWDFTSDSHTGVQLYGSWCDGLMNGTYKNAKVLIGCKGQIIP